jgi:hypothetical protein
MRAGIPGPCWLPHVPERGLEKGLSMIREGIPEGTVTSPEAQYLVASIGVVLVVVGLCGAALADLVSLFGSRPGTSPAAAQIAPMSYSYAQPLEICAAPARTRLDIAAEKQHAAPRHGAVRHVAARHRSLVDVLPDAVAALEESMADVELEFGSALRGARDRIH